MNKKLYVGNLLYETTDDDLKDLFAQAGAVVSANVIKFRDTGRSKGFAFVEMENEEDAKNLCIKYGLLNPLYAHFKRLGCVRCPKQSIQALRMVKELEPEKFQWCLDNDSTSPVKFKPNKTFRECVKGFDND